jgi:5'-nucleotidase
MLDGSELDGPPPLRRASTVEVSTSPPAHHTSRLTRRASLDDLEQESCQLTPKIDHRIIVVNNEEKRHELILQRQRIEQDSIIEEVDEYSPQN